MRAPLMVLVAASLAALAARAAPAVPPAAPEFVVAIDAGHGGSNLGATATDGLLEKNVTLALARGVRAQLEAVPGVRVVLCRDADVLVPIRARARCAAQAHANLFLSLHVNATPAGVAARTQRGFELYVLPPEDVADDAALAARGASGPTGVWAAHLVHAAGERSLVAARALDRRLADALGRANDRGIRQTGAALDVLRGAGAPGVLVEVGFMDHPEDRARLSTPVGRERIAAALALAVTDVAQPRGAPAPAATR
jgi:N-acetylmuramoyl-L-alanine amidase